MITRTYKSAAAFKQALEQRLRTGSTSGTDFARRRQLVVFERFLARVTHGLGDSITLKGGLALDCASKVLAPRRMSIFEQRAPPTPHS